MENGRGPCAAVVGGVNIDIGGTARAPLVMGDSNPGAVRFSLGGVGRNIAHNLSLLGVDVRLLTALGEDLWASRIEGSCALLGIDLTGSLIVPEASTSTYLYLAGPEGDMALAVSDMDIYDRLTPAALEPRLPWLEQAQVLVLDANLPAETIAWLCGRVTVPLFADAVSAAKAGRLKGVLGKLHTLKPNRLEAELLSGVAIHDERSLHRAADALLGTGLRRVFISLGADGVLAADADTRLRLPAAHGEHVNTTGCGDAFLAALVWAQLRGLGLADSARAGVAAAGIAMADAGTVSPRMSAQAVLAGMEEQQA
ncbi:MAG: PfkB family carbohydrate kinase [Eubacteriales bacterium]|nr:PfkB family carbohydrate kinase [Eubacteriales bacterium]